MRMRFTLALGAAVLAAGLSAAAVLPAADAATAPARAAWQATVHQHRPPTLYVADFGSRQVTPVNTATTRAGKPIKARANPDMIAITPNGRTAYVTNSGSDTVSRSS